MMVPVWVLGQVVVVVIALLGITTPPFVGRERLVRLPQTAPARTREIAPYFLGLITLLALNSAVRNFGPELSWIVGWNITGTIHAIEGPFVARLQSTLARPSLTAYFSLVYVYGYVLLLIFPLLAYFALDDDGPLRRTIVAYAINYCLGLVCYIAFIAYGPRNLMPELVDSLLFTTYPKYQLLTSEVNSNTNVFPSLHTSLSVTVALLAAQTRSIYTGWWYVAMLLAGSVVVSTMYLGIHWGIDVIVGAALALLSVCVVDRYVSNTA